MHGSVACPRGWHPDHRPDAPGASVESYAVATAAGCLGTQGYTTYRAPGLRGVSRNNNAQVVEYAPTVRQTGPGGQP